MRPARTGATVRYSCGCRVLYQPPRTPRRRDPSGWPEVAIAPELCERHVPPLLVNGLERIMLREALAALGRLLGPHTSPDDIDRGRMVLDHGITYLRIAGWIDPAGE